jgi:hypothetical protein
MKPRSSKLALLSHFPTTNFSALLVDTTCAIRSAHLILLDTITFIRSKKLHRIWSNSLWNFLEDCVAFLLVPHIHTLPNTITEYLTTSLVKPTLIAVYSNCWSIQKFPRCYGHNFIQCKCFLNAYRLPPPHGEVLTTWQSLPSSYISTNSSLSQQQSVTVINQRMK